MATRTAKKPRMGLDWHNNNLARRSRYLYISLPSLHDYDVKRPIFTFYWGRKNKKRMSDLLFVHVFMTKPEIITFTFCTNIFRLSERKALQEFSEHFASQTAIKRPHRKYRLAIFFFRWLSLSFILKQKLPFSNCLAVLKNLSDNLFCHISNAPSSVIVCSEKSFIVAQLKTHFRQSNCFSSKSNLRNVLKLSEL